jgi:uncharacterized C2H2 Zn-finger protein
MVEHICNKCGKIFNKKCDYKRHTEKKNSCKYKTKKENENIKSIDNKIENPIEINIPNLNNDQKILQNNNDDVLTNILNALKTLTKDMEILKEINDELKESNNELKESNVELNKKIISLEQKVLEIKPSNIKLINNITLNITAFGKEDLTFIENEVCIKKLFYTGFESIKNYVMLVHFNEDKPEYQNIYISNKKNKNEIMVNDGNKWNIAKTNDIIEKIFFKSISFFKCQKDNLKKDILDNKIKGLNRLISEYDDDENKIVKDLSKDIVLIIYNNREKPIGKLIAK